MVTMKVRISYTVEVDDDTRRAIRAYYGAEGLATREEVRNWFIAQGEQGDLVLADEMDDRRHSPYPSERDCAP
jgi:hypothetical protein